MSKDNSKTGSLSARLSVRTGLVLFVLLLILITGILYLSYMHSVRNAEDNLRSAAVINAHTAESYLSRTNEQLKALSRAVSGLQGLPPPQSHAKEESLLKESLSQGFYSVSTYWEPDTFFKSTPDGRVVTAQGSPAQISISAGYTDYSRSRQYSYVRENSLTYITEPYILDGEAAYAVEAVLALRRANGDFLGAVSFVIRLDSLNELVGVSGNYKSAHSYLVTDSGTCIADSNDPGRAGAKLDEQPAVQTELNKTVIDGKSVYKVSVPVSVQGIGTGWTSIFIVDRAEALRQARQNLILSGISALVGLILLILILTAIIRSSLGSFKTVMELARNLDKGQPDADIEIRAGNELTELAAVLINTSRKLGSYANEISSVIKAAARGDMTQRARQDYSGCFLPVKAALDELGSGLNNRLRQLEETAVQLDMCARELTRGVGSMSDSALRQAEVLEKLSSAVSDANDSAAKNARSVKTASADMGQAIETVRRGSEHMQKLVSVMADISEASDEINKVTKLVDDIAFQTNILALNAAVEAVRAGESGKGFGVVAEEVRSLALKSSQAAGTTAELIRQSLDKVRQGVMLTEEAGNAFTEIEDKTGAVNELLAQINMTAAAQEAALKQISKGLSSVSGDLDAAAAAGDRSSAAGKELMEQSARLRAELGEFKL
jgi:methyl-accepting chemotaxis protein